MNNEKLYHIIKLKDLTIKAATSLPASLVKYVNEFFYVKNIINEKIENKK